MTLHSHWDISGRLSSPFYLVAFLGIYLVPSPGIYSCFFFVCLFVCFFNFGYLSVIVLLVLSAAGIVILVSFVCPLVDGDKRLMQAS